MTRYALTHNPQRRAAYTQRMVKILAKSDFTQEVVLHDEVLRLTAEMKFQVTWYQTGNDAPTFRVTADFVQPTSLATSFVMDEQVTPADILVEAGAWPGAWCAEHPFDLSRSPEEECVHAFFPGFCACHPIDLTAESPSLDFLVTPPTVQVPEEPPQTPPQTPNRVLGVNRSLSPD